MIGVASTGTAISTLSSAAATNAALIWLGRDALPASCVRVQINYSIFSSIRYQIKNVC